MVRQADGSLPEVPVRRAQEKEAEKMSDEKPGNEKDYWLGYNAAKDMLRSLLRKVPEERMIGVVMAWLTEEIDDRN